MSDSKPPTPPGPATTPGAGAAPNASTTAAASSGAANYKVAEPNPALRMMGLPALPKKLPSRNWMIFWTITAGISAAIIYDKREKKRATAKWARTVAPLATAPIGDPSEMPRKMTIVMAAPPGEGLRVAQEHFLEYAKPILAASGLDWEFVQGRSEGDVRAAIAEKIRRKRRQAERPDEEVLPTEENVRDAVRQKNGIPEYAGEGGDLVFGRNAWKEYIRGLHEGWLGPLDPPPKPEPVAALKPTTATTDGAASEGAEAEKPDAEKPETEEKKEEEEKKPSRPPQPVPHNTTADYPSAHLPATLPDVFSASIPIQYPHILGFLNTPTRLYRFFNRRALADDVGRQVAAACLATQRREWRDDIPSDDQQSYEQQHALEWEEKNWLKTVFKEDEPPKDGDGKADVQVKEKIWARPVVLDPRIAARMRRYELLPEDEERAKAVVVPESEVEGWIKGTVRSMVRWGVSAFESKPTGPNVGNVDNETV